MDRVVRDLYFSGLGFFLGVGVTTTYYRAHAWWDHKRR